MRRVALVTLLSTSACGALIGLDPPAFDGAATQSDGAIDGASGDDGPPAGDAPLGDDATSDAPIDADGGDSGPIDPCAGASLCDDFEGDASAAPVSTVMDGLVLVDTSVSHSPTHCLEAATNTPMGDYAYASWPAGSYGSGTRVSFWYSTASTFPNGATPIAQIVFSATQTILRVYLTASAVEIEWTHAGVNLGKGSLQGAGSAGFVQVVFVIRDDGVRNAANATILAPPPETLSGPMVLELGILDNLGVAEAVRFDDVVVHPP
ncbi:MAG TPA: hypothetical protein VIF62_40085 [Labilithrix sp.]